MDQDQVPVAEQFAAAVADLGIQAGRPGQALPPGELVAIALAGVGGHRLDTVISWRFREGILGKGSSGRAFR